MNEDIAQSVDVLRRGGIILYPTDTIWGIGCDATNSEAVDRIYKLKKRSDSKSMLVLLGNENLLQQYVKEVPDIAWELLEVADKPMTIIYPGAKNLAPNLIAENGSIGIRIPKDVFCQKLMARFKKPIVSTSANISGQASPSCFADIHFSIKESVDYIVKWKQTVAEKAHSSSIIQLGRNGQIEILRN